jgi:hypothetical protein
MTRSKSRAGSYLALVPSSTRLPRWTHHGWPDTILYNIHKEIGYRPTRRHEKLLSLEIPYVSYASVHFKYLFIQTQLTWALINIGGGYHLGAPNIRLDHSSSFPSSILHFSLIACPVFNYVILSTIQVLNIPISNQGIKVLNLMSGVCHSTSTGVLYTKNSTTIGFSTTIGARWYTKGIMHSRVSFNSYNINVQIK